MKGFAILLLLVGISAVHAAPQSLEFAIFEVINSAIPNVIVNITPSPTIRPVVNVPFVPSRGNSAFATARGPSNSRIVARTSVSRNDDD